MTDSARGPVGCGGVVPLARLALAMRSEGDMRFQVGFGVMGKNLGKPVEVEAANAQDAPRLAVAKVREADADCQLTVRDVISVVRMADIEEAA